MGPFASLSLPLCTTSGRIPSVPASLASPALPTQSQNMDATGVYVPASSPKDPAAALRASTRDNSMAAPPQLWTLSKPVRPPTYVLIPISHPIVAPFVPWASTFALPSTSRGISTHQLLRSLDHGNTLVNLLSGCLPQSKATTAALWGKLLGARLRSASTAVILYQKHLTAYVRATSTAAFLQSTILTSDPGTLTLPPILTPPDEDATEPAPSPPAYGLLGPIITPPDEDED
ncbi:hypothetical protein CC78DRAFT_538445 [Lojkania enalia]|uniref:Uncharacterized protein n=1 Tax=Lojkania enalia TaxID=147567 RepID=A0A9P4JW21_9PLEO|nr:hypothetical protein CC78DRAFT_538445 [Didymosphaeria enalia]